MEHYYMSPNNNYNRVYDYVNATYPMSNSIFSSSSSTTNNSTSQSQQQHQQQQQEWRNMEQQQYVYQQPQRNNSSSTSGIHYLSQHHQDPISLIQQHDARLYKAKFINGEILSPGDSGIGADMSLLDQVTKNDFFAQNVAIVQQQQSQVIIYINYR